MKKGNIPIFKKGDKQSIKNFNPVSFFQYVARFSNVSYTMTLKHFLDITIISPKQSGFRLDDSCVNQLLSIIYDIFTSFDSGLEVRGVFLDIATAFDKVWRNGFIYKLKQNGVKDELFCLLRDFLKNR